MPRTFKFSFPLPGRKPRNESENIHANLLHPYYNDVDGYPHCSPGIKAEQVLGTNDPSSVTPSEKTPFWSKKWSSFMSVRVSDHDTGSVLSRDPAHFTSKDAHVGFERRPELARNQPSSPLPGELDRPRAHPLRDDTRTSLNTARSSSTMNSSYNARYEPPVYVQRSTVPSPRAFAALKSPKATNSARQAYSLQCLSQEDEPQQGLDAQNYPRRKPSNLDLNGLCQPPRIVSPSISSPHLYTRTSSQVPAIPVRHGSDLRRGKWLGRYWTRKGSATSRMNDSVQMYRPYQPDLYSAPYSTDSATRSPRQWLHEIGESDGSDELKHEDLVGYPLSEDPISSLIGGRNDVLQRRRNSVSKGDQLPDVAKSRDNDGPRTAIIKSRSNTLDSMKSREAKSSISNASAASEPSDYTTRKNKASVDRLNQSVLSLSSSEDESEEPSTTKPRYLRHRIRESVDRTDKGDKPFVSNAQCVIPVKPRPILHSKNARREKSRSNSSELVPPVPSIPARPLPTARVSSIRWQERMNAQNAVKEIESLSSTELQSLGISSRATTHLRSNSQQRKSSLAGKMIAVTPEEEMLLKTMRRKRASIRTESSSEGRSIASLLNGNNNVVTRPKTSGDERKSQEVVLDGSRAPSLSGYDLAKTLNRPFSVSADSLPQNEAFPFPQMVPSPKEPPSIVSISNKRSPDSSFSPSDSLPSPTSRQSPKTPPPDYSPRPLPKEVNGSPYRPLSLTSKAQHKRERTISSGVVVLDGVEQKAQQLDDEDEIVGWAVNQCPW